MDAAVPADALWRRSACEVVELLRRRAVGPVELLEATIKRIAAVDPMINALPLRRFDAARREALQLQADPPAPGSAAYLLAGLPIAVKDMSDVAGLPTTYGDPALADNVATANSPFIGTLMRNGAIIVGKTNVPFGGISPDTVNPLFGLTRNPLDLRLSTAGSSGGAAAALAAGEVWLAAGSDLGGSIRMPAAMCGLVGLRPSPGRVPRVGWQGTYQPFDFYTVEGPMARSVEDVALFLDAMVADDSRAAIGMPAPATSFLAAAQAPALPRRIAFTTDYGMGGMDPAVPRAIETALASLAGLGVSIEADCADFSGGDETVYALRRAMMRERWDIARLERSRDSLHPSAVRTVEDSLALTIEELTEAAKNQARMFASMTALFERCDLLVGPVLRRLPYRLGQAATGGAVGADIASRARGWGSPTYLITTMACPALSMPAGFTADGRPIAMQLVAPPRHEARLLAWASGIEAAIGLSRRVPLDPVLPQTGDVADAAGGLT
jgi:amidase